MHPQRGAAAAIADHGRRRLDSIVDDLMERQWREVPELWVTDDPAFRQAVRRSTHENTELVLAAIGRPFAIPKALPPGPCLEASLTAQHGASAAALLRSYRVGQQTLVEHFIDAVDTGEIPRPAEALRVATQTLHDYVDRVLPLVAREHAAERERLEARPDLRLLRRVQAALRGDASVDLGYPLGTTHMAVVAGGQAAGPAIEAAACALEVDTLSLPAPDGRRWAWLAMPTRADLRERLDAAGLEAAGVAGPSPGPSGFRMAHGQAKMAERVARAGHRVVHARSAVLEILALGDQQMAWELARAELGPLADGERHDPLRVTLATWFASQESVGATATLLGVAPRTVSYRLRRAGELLGHPVAERRAELEAALRIWLLFQVEGPPLGG
jgi:PucR C-terminal helix-turn-helix domain